MKHLFYLAAFAAICAACSNNEIMDTAPPKKMKQIEMSGSFINNPTRGALTTQTLTKFAVWAWQNQGDDSHRVFDGAVVRQQLNGSWQYDNTRYWIPDRTYRFFALASSKNDSQTLTFQSPAAVSAWNNISFTYTLGPNRPFDDDLVYATKVVTTPEDVSGMQPVDLTFNHVLSQLTFTIIDNTPPDHSLKVSNISYKGAKQGTCTLKSVQPGTAPAVSWAIPTSQITVPLSGGPNDNAFWTTHPANPIFVIPALIEDGVASNGTLSLKAQLYDKENPADDEEPIMVKTLTGTISYNFVPGGSYHVKLTIGIGDMTSNKPIVFTVTQLNEFGDWEDYGITPQ